MLELLAEMPHQLRAHGRVGARRDRGTRVLPDARDVVVVLHHPAVHQRVRGTFGQLGPELVAVDGGEPAVHDLQQLVRRAPGAVVPAGPRHEVPRRAAEPRAADVGRLAAEGVADRERAAHRCLVTARSVHDRLVDLGGPHGQAVDLAAERAVVDGELQPRHGRHGLAGETRLERVQPAVDHLRDQRDRVEPVGELLGGHDPGGLHGLAPVGTVAEAEVGLDVLEDRLHGLLGEQFLLDEHVVPAADGVRVARGVLQQAGADAGGERAVGGDRAHQVDPLDRDRRRPRLPDEVPRTAERGERVLEERVVLRLLDHVFGLEPDQPRRAQRVGDAAGHPQRGRGQIMPALEQVGMQRGLSLAVAELLPDGVSEDEFECRLVLRLDDLLDLVRRKSAIGGTERERAAHDLRELRVAGGRERHLDVVQQQRALLVERIRVCEEWDAPAKRAHHDSFRRGVGPGQATGARGLFTCALRSLDDTGAQRAGRRLRALRDRHELVELCHRNLITHREHPLSAAEWRNDKWGPGAADDERCLPQTTTCPSVPRIDISSIASPLKVSFTRIEVRDLDRCGGPGNVGPKVIAPASIRGVPHARTCRDDSRYAFPDALGRSVRVRAR